MLSSSLTHSHLVYGTCPEDGYMPPWEYVSRQAFYSSTYYPYIPLLSVYYLDRTVTDVVSWSVQCRGQRRRSDEEV